MYVCMQPAMLLFALGFFTLSVTTRSQNRSLYLLTALVLGAANGMTAGIVQLIAQDKAPQGAAAAPFIGLWSVSGCPATKY